MSRKVIGPTCEECGKHRGILIPIWRKKETPYGVEMVKVFVCLLHFAIICDRYEVDYPEDSEDFKKDWEKAHPEDKDDEEDGDIEEDDKDIPSQQRKP